ncbi:CbtB domain-containing protein [Rhodopseudomonas pseudopalustris]|uniref:Cobalt transporter subunit CbtB n=1 Tax=Rhodopseudomonas pseudopalustris TaxID=1513892 RepID=A0A1H8LUB2_9BRAD|nr:CbtB domain-containing protein [Rhodopseudomonas pseudopalustris]SEO08695.1 cobalt transporter subunit CbtB [Rhodopseudomonas pseudopalustris]
MSNAHTLNPESDTAIRVTTTANVVVQAAMAMALGLIVVGMVGFSHISAVHNAAHDVRHANAFPCH